MGTLSSCLKKIGLSEHESAILRGSADNNMKDGDAAHVAAVRAVSDYLEQLEAERAGVVSQIEAKGGKSHDAPFKLADISNLTAVLRNANSPVENQASSPTMKVSPRNDGEINANPVPAGNVSAIGSQRVGDNATSGDGDRESLGDGMDENSQGAAGIRGVSGSTEATGDAGAGSVQSSGSSTSGPARNLRPVRPQSDAAASNGSVDSDFEIDADEIGKGGLAQKYKDNIEAIKIAKAIDAEGRKSTAEERRKISKYVGWGALKGVFDPNNKQWSKQHAELKDLLTEEEWKAARKSILNAHYTSPIAVKAMYEAFDQLGFKGGRILEPSVGVGNFFGLMSKDMRAASDLHGVELDVLTSKFVAALYPKAKIAKATGFQDYSVPSEFFDAVIGNPPFGPEPIVDMDRSPYSGFSIHNYFLAKSIDKLRPGGIMQIIVSHSFLDAMDERARKWIWDRAALIGAARLPNTAFKENAGTEVVTDILIFQKRDANGLPNDVAEWRGTVDQQNINPKTGETVTHRVNQFFAKSPQFVLGKPSAAGKQYAANEYTVEPTGDLADQLIGWVNSLPANIYTPIERAKSSNVVDMAIPDGVKPGSYFVAPNGDVMQRGEDVLGEMTATPWEPRNAKAVDRMKGMIGLRDLLRAQMRLERSLDATEEQIEANRGKLNEAYDAFLKSYGHINNQTNRGIFLDDTEAQLVQALEFDYDKGISKSVAEREEIEPREPSATKADIFTRRVAFPPSDTMKVETAKDALLASLNYRGKIDRGYMESVYGKPISEIIDELGDVIYEDPQSGFVTADEYLSGDVKTKLEEAKEAAADDPRFARNVYALEKVIPEDKKPSEINVSIGANFVPVEVYLQFVRHITGAGAKMAYIKGTGQWIIYFDSAADAVLNAGKFGTSDANAQELFKLLLQGRGVVIKKILRNPDGSTTTILMEKETEAAREKQNAIKNEWQSWLWKDPERATNIATIYNERMNRIVERKYDGSHMTFPGMNPAITLLDHQNNGVWRGLQSFQTLYDHVVGAGKAQPLDAKVLTPTGWKLMGDIAVGDYVISVDGQPALVEAVFPQGEKEIFRVEFSDGSATECCEEHLWLTQTYRERTLQQRAIKAGKSWPAASAKVRSLAEIRGSIVSDHLGAKNHSIPMVLPVEFERQDVPVSPYLMGVLLGDGGFSHEGVTITTADNEIIDRCSSLVPFGTKLGSVKTGNKCQTWTVTNIEFGSKKTNPMKLALDDLGLRGLSSHEKFIPDCYLFNEVETRIELLRGLMDTDGSVQRHSSYFYTCSERLADGVTFLVQSLGGTVSRSVKHPKFKYKGVEKNGRPCFVLCVKMPAGINPFCLTRKASAVVPKTSYAPVRYITNVKSVGFKPAQCIRVAHQSHLYVTDDFVVTHNTFEMVALAMEMRRLGISRKPLFVVPNHLTLQWRSEFTRLYPGSNVLAAAPEDFSKDNRGRLFSKIITGDWDAVIIGHSSLKKIGLPAETEQAILQEQIDEVAEAIEAMKRDRGDRNIIRDMERIRSTLEAKMKDKLAAIGKRDKVVTFDELGIDAMLVDECFPYDTPVMTDIGIIKIGELVEKQLNVNVLSVNVDTGAIEWKPVVRWIPVSRKKTIVKVTHENGYFTCTSDHKIWTDRGYVKAEALLQTDKLHLMQSDVLATRAGAEGLRQVHDGYEGMPVVQQGIQLSQHGEGERGEAEVLQEFVCSKLEEFGPGENQGVQSVDGRNTWSFSPWEKVAAVVGKNDEKQSDEPSGDSGESKQGESRENIPVSRRKFKDYSSTAKAGGYAQPSTGVSDQDKTSEGAIRVSAELLQGGPSFSGSHVGSRSGWAYAQNKEVEILGQTKNFRIERTRVVGVEILESGSFGESGVGGENNSTVYDIEVADNHNFFAAGVLVSNCHEFKNLAYNSTMDRNPGMGNPAGSAKAFDMFVKVRWLFDTFGEKTPFITATGTPVSNSLVEMFNMQRFMQYPTLKKEGLHVFDAWAKQFGNVESVYEVAPSGTGYRQSTRFSKFSNLPALMNYYNSFADTVTLDDLKAQEEARGMRFPVPKIVSGGPVNIVAKRSPQVANFMGVPRAEVDERGDIRFDLNVGEKLTPMIEQDEKTGKWTAAVNVVFSDGKEENRKLGVFESREDAELKIVERAITPKVTVDPESILGQFGNLRQLTKESKGKINALSLTNLANKAGLDFRLINPAAPDFPGSKINLSINEMMRVYDQWKADKGAQLVFCDMSIPLSAKKSYAAKERRLYVRNEAGAVEMKRGTLHAADGVEFIPFFVVQRGQKADKRFDIYDATTGAMTYGGFATRQDAKDEAANLLQNQQSRENWMEIRDEFGEITDEETAAYNDENEIDTAELDIFSKEDIQGASGAGDFSVYDDIKAKLIARGVPEREIAFIHDYNTPTSKAKLFAAVNSGDIRFLLGSTPKMGAGTNVQKRLVALHHIDAPWRPSDLEQREGRIIRRGNELYARDPDGFEVFIGRYATEQTYDTRRWQILEHKARGIEQLRNFDGTINEIEDIDGEAANAADMKAAASGDPLILEETKLRNDVIRLERLQAAHADEQLAMMHRAQTELRFAKESGPLMVSAIRSMMAAVKGQPTGKKDDFKATLAGAEFTDIDDFAKRLEFQFELLRARSANRFSVGFRGQRFIFDNPWVNTVSVETDLGRLASWGVNENFSGAGFVTRMQNFIERLPAMEADTLERIEKAFVDAESMKVQAAQPFGAAADLEEARRKHITVRRALMAKGPAVPDEQKPLVAKGIERQKKALIDAGFGKAVSELFANRTDFAAFSLGKKVAKSEMLSKSAIVSEIEPILAQFDTEIPVRIVEDIPEDVARSVGMNDGEAPSGFVHGGKIWLVRSGIADVRALRRVLFHEMLHFGIRRFMAKDQYIETMKALYDADKTVRNVANAWANTEEAEQLAKSGQSPAYIMARATDEALATIAEELNTRDIEGLVIFNRKDLGLMQAIKNWVAGIARKLGMNDIADMLYQRSDDVKIEQATKDFILSMFDGLKSGRKKNQEGVSSWAYSDPAFSRMQTAGDKLKSEVAKWSDLVESYLSGKIDRTRSYLMLEHTPASMMALGLPDLQIRTGSHMLDYANVRLTRDQLDSLPEQLANPKFVYIHDGNNGLSINFVTDIENTSGNLVVALKPNQHVREASNAHFVATVVNVRSDRIISEAKHGNALFVRTKDEFDGLRDALDFAQKKNGRQASEVREQMSRSYGLSSLVKRLVFPSDLVKMVSEGRAQYSKDAKSTSVSPAEIRSSLIDRFGERGIKALEQAGVLKIVRLSEAPADMRALAEEQGASALYGADGVAYLFSDRMTAEDAPGKLLHEIGEHHGLERMLGGDGWSRMKKRIAAMAKAKGSVAYGAWQGVKENYAEFAGKSDAELAGNERFLHEVLAAIGENKAGLQTSLWREMLAAIKEWLAAKGLLVDWINEGDIANLVSGSLKKVMRDAEAGLVAPEKMESLVETYFRQIVSAMKAADQLIEDCA